MSDPGLVAALLVALSLVTIVLVAVVALLWLRLRRLAADQRRAFEGVEVDVLATLARHARRLDAADAATATVDAHSRAVRDHVGRTLSRIGIVRYDAFEDAGGELSFSAAIVDEHQDGVVLTSINGRTGGRTYLKPLVAGDSPVLLSDEERAAVAAAAEGRSEHRVANVGKRTWRRRETMRARS